MNSLHPLLAMISFPGLSDEQALITTLVSQNPAANDRLRSRARSLLMLHDGATPSEVTHETSSSRRSILDLIQRFRTGGLCSALLGAHPSTEGRMWLTLSPGGPPRVRLKSPLTNRRRVVDSRLTGAIPRH